MSESEAAMLDLQPTNLYLTYADLALLHECVEDCMGANRVELTQLQRMPEDTVGRGERLRWLQNRNRLLRKLESRVARVGPIEEDV